MSLSENSIGLDDHAGIRDLIGKVAERSPQIAEVMQVLAEGRERLAAFDREELADAALDLRRSHLAVFLTLIHEADGYMGEVIVHGGAFGEWPISPDTLQSYCHHKSEASAGLAHILEEIVQPRR
jgi:hypothetical protein